MRFDINPYFLKGSGGVAFNNFLINAYNHARMKEGSMKLNLYIGLGCKAMEDVVLHHPDWKQSGQGCIPIGLFDIITPFDNPDMYIEAIPERLNEAEIVDNINVIQVKDYEILAGKYVRGEIGL